MKYIPLVIIGFALAAFATGYETIGLFNMMLAIYAKLEFK